MKEKIANFVVLSLIVNYNFFLEQQYFFPNLHRAPNLKSVQCFPKRWYIFYKMVRPLCSYYWAIHLLVFWSVYWVTERSTHGYHPVSTIRTAPVKTLFATRLQSIGKHQSRHRLPPDFHQSDNTSEDTVCHQVSFQPIVQHWSRFRLPPG